MYFSCFSINTIKMLSKLYNTNQQQIYNLLLELKFCFQEQQQFHHILKSALIPGTEELSARRESHGERDSLDCGDGMSRNRRAETKTRKAFLVYCHICWWSSFRTLMTCKIPFCLTEPNLIVIQLNSNISCYVSSNRRKLLFMTH